MGCTYQRAGSGDPNLWDKVPTLPAATDITDVVQFLTSQLIAVPLGSFTLQRTQWATPSLQWKAGDKLRGYTQHMTEHPRTS